MLDRMLLSAGGEEKLYVEDVFSTYLYTGNGSTQTITNGIDLAGKGGLVWFKNRANTTNHILFDTARNAFALSSNLVNAQGDYTGYFSFTSSGFSVGAIGAYNANGNGIASWSFRKAPKFFDVVTYNGTGTSSQTLSHNLGVAPGLIIVKRTNSIDSWKVYHRGLASPNTSSLILNTTDSVTDWGIALWGQPSDTSFSVNNNIQLNTSGGTYVAYLFAHDPTADGIIQCGSYTGNGAANGPTVTLGWEPQWVMVKNASSTSVWTMVDNMRGMTASGDCGRLDANQSASEGATTGYPLAPNATGFQVKGATAFNGNGQTSVYIAIRRGPMKTPTLGTSVFAPVLQAANSTAQNKDYGIVTDAVISKARNSSNVYTGEWWDRLRGATLANTINSTDFEKIYASSLIGFDYQTGVRIGTDTSERIQQSCNWVHYAFRRAPGFFDVVCYTGTGNPLTLNHNLGVAPELIIYKARSSGYSWIVQSSAMNVVSDYLILNATSAKGTTMTWRTPTSTTFGVNMSGNVSECNYAGTTYVAYLFASCPGVSKVGSYTGNGSSQTINCGFSSGARFFLVKRTDSSGSWWVYDSARGIVAAADPALQLNSTAAEITSADAVDTDSTGIIVNQEATCNINVNGGTYIYLAIA